MKIPDIFGNYGRFETLCKWQRGKPSLSQSTSWRDELVSSHSFSPGRANVSISTDSAYRHSKRGEQPRVVPIVLS
jgi:hypothetical protein